MATKDLSQIIRNLSHVGRYNLDLVFTLDQLRCNLKIEDINFCLSDQIVDQLNLWLLQEWKSIKMDLMNSEKSLGDFSSNFMCNSMSYFI